MTENEAQVTQCCGPDGCGYFNDDPRPARWCVASACMAWRWDEPWTGMTEEGSGGDLVYRISRKPGQPRQGFCGLGGVPRLL